MPRRGGGGGPKKKTKVQKKKERRAKKVTKKNIVKKTPPKVKKVTKAPRKGSNRRSIFDSKFSLIMNEYKLGTLKTSRGVPVFNRKQAIAIAFSEAEMAVKRGTIAKPRRVPKIRRSI